MTVRARLRADRGSGSVLAFALLAAVALLTLSAVGLGAGLAARQRVIGAADAAALAGADALSGFRTGEPCAMAQVVALANGASVVSCAASGADLIVEVTGRFGPVDLLARSRAGPPPESR